MCGEVKFSSRTSFESCRWLAFWLSNILPHVQENLTIEFTAVELHADCGLVVPVDRMEPNESPSHRRKKGIFLCLIGFLVSSEYLVKDEETERKRSDHTLNLCACREDQQVMSAKQHT